MATVNTLFSKNATMALQRAILLYEGDNHSYATIHDVTNHDVTNDRKGKQSIGAGSPLDIATLGAIVDSLGRNASIGGFLPSNILSIGFDSMVWWVKPAPRRVFFKTNEDLIGERSADVPHPGLVFGVNSNGLWAVCAVKGNSRPDEDTPVWQAPYFNVWEGGKVCTGTVDIPRSIAVADIPKWEEAFFSSNFVHPNVHLPKRLINRKATPYQFWKSMLDGEYKKFPTQVLVPLNGTLKNFIEKVNGGKGK